MKSLSRKAARFWAILRHQGPGAAVRRGRGWILDRIAGDRTGAAAYFAERRRHDADYDAATGLDTGGIIGLDRLTIAGPNGQFGNAYMATTPAEFEAALAALDLPVEGATYVDLGSGKGRTLFMAARHPFARIIGVEFAAELHATAVSNLALLPDERRIELVHGDAAAFALPPGPVVLFIYNAFDRPLMARIAERLHGDWRDGPERPVRVMLVNPVLEEVWHAAGWQERARGPAFRILAP